MRLLPRLLFSVLLLAGLHVHAQGLLGTVQVQSEQTTATLLAHAPEGVNPGAPVWVGLQIEHAPHWHTYWKNSGDSGLPTELQWTLPHGVVAGDIAWPTPRKFPLSGLANYGYDGTVLLPVPLQVDPSFQGSQLEIRLSAAWLACRKECIPEEGNFTLRIPVQGSTALHGGAFDAARAALPQDLPAGDSALRPEPGFLQASVAGLPAAWQGQPLEFFPETPGLIEPGKDWQQAWDGGRWTARVPLSAFRSDSPAEVPLVLALANPPGSGPGTPGVRLITPVQGAWPAAAPLPAALPPELQKALDEQAAGGTGPATGGGAPITLWAALIGALIGGLILNLMPCVFPVLAIKVLAFAQHADDRAAHRRAGPAYTAGVGLSFMALGGLLATLFTVIGLNLAGLFEFGSMLPSGVASLQARSPTGDAFLTGVLAVAIASPCTAPFMGASLGLAIALPAWQALAVFALLGLGMALPYLAASWWPAVARALPRPGAWMNTFRQLMAFPMFATVVWLLWVLGQQSGIDGAAALLMLLVVLALLIWALGLQGKSRTVLGGMAAVALLWLGIGIGPHVTRLQAANSAGAPVATSVQGLNWEAWSPERQAALLAEGRPVFVDYTAAWCVTCQYNKRTTLADTGLLAERAAKNVALLRADWTRRDPVITAELAKLGRNGVPVYTLLRTGREPVVLNEVLGVDEVRAALARL